MMPLLYGALEATPRQSLLPLRPALRARVITIALFLVIPALIASTVFGQQPNPPERQQPDIWTQSAQATLGSPTQPNEPKPSPDSSSGVTASADAGTGTPQGTFSVEAFQTDLFTGAATTQIPIVVLSGAAGVAPKISLGYNSGTVDELQPRNQGQMTGLGWTLDVGGFIFRDTKNTTTTTDDTFKLVFGGVRYDLVLIDSAQNIYHTKDEIFLKIQYFPSSDHWILTTKDGTQHQFGYNTDSKAITRGQDLTTAITYKYLLDQATTTSGVAVQYAYTKQTATISSTGKTYDQAVYPATVTWAYAGGSTIGSARQVVFTYASRSDFTDTSATTYMSFFERSRLDTIGVRVGGSLVRKYVLNFDYSIDRDPSYTWGGGATGDLTLRTITLYGADGASALPSLGFSYSSARLSSVNNGIGGSVTYGYERVTTVPLYWAYGTFTYADGCSNWQARNDPGPWQCDPSAVALGYTLTTSVAGTVPLYWAYSTFTYDDWCSSWQARNDPGPSPCDELAVALGYTLTTSAAGTVPLYWAYSTFVYGDGCSNWQARNDPGPGPCNELAVPLGYTYVGEIDRYRVVTRTVSDGRGGTSTLAFVYTGLGLSDDGTEFRGHASVRAVDPLGHYTDNWFYQDDLLKGRPYHSQTRHSNGSLLIETTNTWSTTTPYPGITFAKLVQTDATTCDDSGANCKQSRQSVEYDAYGNQTRTYSFGDLAVTGDERDEYTDWVVDTTNWLHRAKRTALYDASGGVLRERWLSYDGLGWGSLGSRGLLTREERRLVGAQGTPGNPVVTSSYDAYGNRTATTDARGCATTTVYESSQTYPASVTTCLGHTTTFTFDAGWGGRTSETDPNNQTTTYTYDTFGRLTKTIGPLDSGSLYGSMSRFYLDFGNASTQRILIYRTTVNGTANFIWSDDYFDGLGRNYLSRSQGPGSQTIQRETTYDARGLIATQSAPHFSTEAAVVTQFTYDARGRQTQALYPDGTSVGTAYAPGLVTVTDPRGNIKRRFLDIYGRLTRVEEVNGNETYVTSYAYDAADALVRVTNQLNHVTTLTYDLLGRKTAMSDPNMGSWTYSYDVGGSLLSQTDANNRTLTFTYDQQSRVLTKTYPGGAQIQWTYDDPAVAYSRGRVTRIADLAAVTTFTYDALGRITQTQRLLDGTTYAMSQSYNAQGEVTSRTFPDGDSVSYTFDEAGWLASIPRYIINITYNARHQQTQVQYANGVVSTWTYHPTKFRVANRTTTGPSGSLQNIGYAYDPAGNITQITDGVFTGGRTFTYDALNRLTATSGTFGAGQASITQNYQYDAIGNILQKAGVLYTYSDPLHPSAVTSRSDGPIYSHDANGNMITGAGRALTWDSDNRLSAVTIQGGNSATFAYDAAGVRVRKQTSAGVWRYPFAGYEIGPSGVVTKYLGGVAKKSTGAVLFYHNDHLGGVNVITDASGARVQLLEYDPWGQVSRSEGNADPTHRFTGKELDPETGLYYYGGRYYDAVLGRFVTADPFVPAPGNPQSLNRYSYVLNSPVNLIDPSGYSFFGFLKKLFRFGRNAEWQVFKIAAPIVVGIVVGIVVTSVTGNPVVGGFVGGAAAGAVNYGLNGGDPARSILLGAALGAIGGAIGPELSGALGGGWQGAVGSGAILGGAFGGISAAIYGGDVLQGIAYGAVTGAVVSAVVYASYQTEEGAESDFGGRHQDPHRPFDPNATGEGVSPGEAWPTESRQVDYGDYFTSRHPAVDIRNCLGCPVRAVAGGDVVGTRIGQSGLEDSFVQIRAADSYHDVYSHARPIVTRGMTVAPGQVIGTTDMSGVSTGPHLHYELRMPSNGPSINPGYRLGPRANPAYGP